MRIAIIGTVVLDRIRDVRGKVTESPGGLLYSISGLQAVCDKDDRIIPISRVGSDFYDSLCALLKEDERIELNGLIPFEGKNNRVELTYNTPQERVERSLHPMPPLKIEDLAPAFTADVVLLNFISGWEMELETYQELATNIKGPLSVDLHSLTLARDPDGTRRPRFVENIGPYLQPANVIQFNENEFKRISKENLQRFFKIYCFDQYKIVNLTLGHRGSLTVYRSGEEVKSLAVAPPAKIKVVDPTGCGDVFFVGFAIPYFKTKDVAFSAEQANRLAALSGMQQGLPQWRALREKFNQKFWN